MLEHCEYKFANPMFFLHVAQLCEYCRGTSLAETNQFDGCISPYETRGMMGFGDGMLEALPWPALLPVCHHCPPPSGGDLTTINITASWLRLTDLVTTLSMKAL